MTLPASSVTSSRSCDLSWRDDMSTPFCSTLRKRKIKSSASFVTLWSYLRLNELLPRNLNVVAAEIKPHYTYNITTFIFIDIYLSNIVEYYCNCFVKRDQFTISASSSWKTGVFAMANMPIPSFLAFTPVHTWAIVTLGWHLMTWWANWT